MDLLSTTRTTEEYYLCVYDTSFVLMEFDWFHA